MNASDPNVRPNLRLDDLLAELQKRLDAVLAARDRTHGLLEAVVSIGSGLDLDSLLHRLTEAAMSLVGARYGALGVIGEGVRLARFVPVGLTEEEILRIEHWPEGQGVLGLLVKHPQVLRLSDIRDHPESYGFPPGHPPMTSFLGAPIRVGDEVFGNLYLTDKRGGADFDDEDEAVIVALAAAAGVAIENARLYEQVRHREQWLGASEQVTRALLSGADPEEVLGQIARLAREITGARLGLLAFPDDTDRFLRVRVADSTDGDVADRMPGRTVDIDASLIGAAYRNAAPAETDDATRHGRTPLLAGAEFGPVLCVPLAAGDTVRGVLEVAGPHGAPPYDDDTLRTLHAFANQAAVALELAEHRRDAERLLLLEDRDRIAKDLHDQVIQRLFATGIALTGAARLVHPDIQGRLTTAVNDLDDTIKQIRTVIFGLQPLERDTSLQARLLNLALQAARPLGFTPDTNFSGLLDSSVPAHIGEHAAAVLHELLSNTARHAQARHAWIDVTVDASENTLLIRVTDDGVGSPPDGPRSGLRNLDRRAAELGGTFSLGPRPEGGTVATWHVPLVPSS